VPQTPHARTCRSTPSSGHSASGAVPTSMLPGPFQIAARTALLRRLEPVLAYQLSDNYGPGVQGSGALNDRVHLHAHARRRHAVRRARGVRLDCSDGRPPRRLQGRRAPHRGAQGADGRHPLQRPRDLDRGRVRDRGGRARLRPRRRRDPPRPPDRRHADREGPGDPRRHRREVLALRRPDRRASLPAARLDRRDRRGHQARRRARRRRHQPARLPLRRRRRGAHPRRRRRRPTCRSSAPARSTPSSASARSRRAAPGPSRSARPRSTACSWRTRR
jgi:hypothetical protein